MFRATIFLFTFISTVAFAQEREMMYRITEGETSENCGYVNENGDTLFPIGTFAYCFSDSLNFAIVESFDGKEGFLTIDSEGNEIFRVFAFDNGPDYIKSGTMRIIEDGKIGYANEAGEIIIEPQYEGGWPFEDGQAQVSLKATKVRDGEHWFWTDTDWFYIDMNGNRVEE